MSDDLVSGAKGEAGGLLRARSAAARHRGVPAYDRSPLRGPREIRARARRGHEGRQADPARSPRRTPPRTIPTPDGLHTVGTIGDRAAAAEAARPDRAVLVEGKVARARHALHRRRDFFQADDETIAEEGRRAQETEALAAHRSGAISSSTSSSTRRSRPRCWSRSTRSTIPRKLADTRRLASRRSRFPRSRSCWRRETVTERLEKVFGPMEARSACSRSRSASARASSARWRRRSASIISTSS